ncbi:MAG: patatin-like phospholipase family protein [Roseburia sp.]|nr:patatin-like phospholipase family protein [Roseburia sp.]
MKALLGFGGPEYRTGLVLSGGGARGFAHAGAIRALNECGIYPDIIAGVSAGSVAAVLYAAGIRPERMVELFESSHFSDFCEFGMPKDGFFNLNRFRKFLRANIEFANLEDLPIKTLVGATDLDNGRKVMFETGPLAERVAASCSIPIVFKPVRIDGIRYVDGGVLHNLPAWSIRHRCKYLIGINCSPLINRSVGNSLIDIAMRSYELMAKTNVIGDMELCDIVIRNEEIARYKVFNLRQIQKVYESGYNDTMTFLLSHGFQRVTAAQSSTSESLSNAANQNSSAMSETKTTEE